MESDADVEGGSHRAEQYYKIGLTSIRVQKRIKRVWEEQCL